MFVRFLNESARLFNLLFFILFLFIRCVFFVFLLFLFIVISMSDLSSNSSSSSVTVTSSSQHPPGAPPGETQSAVGVPSAPLELVAVHISVRFITLSWKPPVQSGSSDVSGYTVYWKESTSDR